MADWYLVTGPSLEPITIAEAKAHARISQSDDGMLRRYILAARETAEAYMSRGLYTQTWKLILKSWADEMYLPMAAPLQNDAFGSPSTAPIVEYYDADGVLTTLDASVYLVDTASRPGRIVRSMDQSWPTLQSTRKAGRIEITYVVGWSSIAAIPERIKQGVRMYIAYLDFDRDGLDEQGKAARQAAEACWDDRVRYLEPQCA
jgi:uncharacterized phiE125 gp8 family phage protein